MFLTAQHALLNVANRPPCAPYRPSNGTEGELFRAYFCSQCKHRDDDVAGGCEIALRAYAYDIDDPSYPAQWIHGPDGQPMCTEFEYVRYREQWDELLDQVSGIDTRPLDGHERP